MARERTILHCDMDAFYAAIEQRDHPQWRGKPVVVAGLGARGVVSTASYEARKFGVHSAMPTAQARRLAPDAIYVFPRMSCYVQVSQQIRAIFDRYTPLVEPLSLDEAFLDVSASRELFGDGVAIAQKIQKDVADTTQLTVSVGVAASKFVAKVASDLNKPNGVTAVPSGREIEFLSELPISRLWGAGKVTEKRLAGLGMLTIADLQRWTVEDLSLAIGASAAEHFYQLAHGIDPRPVDTDRDAKSIGREVTFDTDIRDDEECASVLLTLSESVGRRMRSEGVRGKCIKLKLRYPPFETLSRQRTLDAPTHDDLVIYRAALELLETARPTGKPVRLLGVSVSDLGSGAIERQSTLFENPRSSARKEHLLKALDKIKDKFGDGAIGHGKPDSGASTGRS
ncbi:MAG: DNA polymerase IV [Planctomycetes bacterium]|nr:DNA polymerase IV [Planctomycetota bacterium]